MAFIIEILAGLAGLILLIYLYATWTYDYWRKRGVPGPTPKLRYGTFEDVFLGKTYVGDYVTQQYKIYKDEPMFGLFSRRKPVLILNDADLIKTVLVKDFSSFNDRGFRVHGKVEPLMENLFFLEPARWKALRTKLSPVFTTGKLKEMFYLLLECANDFGKFFEQVVAKNSEIECYQLMARFNINVIGVCAFGLNLEAMDENNPLYRFVGHGAKKSIKTIIENTLKNELRFLYNLLWPLWVNHEVNNFFINMVTETMEFRKKNNIKKHDLIDLLIELKDRPRAVGDLEMTDALLTAQAFGFLVGGHETTCTTQSNALYELALHQSAQDKVREEINAVYAKNNGSLTFESIKDMEYLDKVISETLRLHPVALVQRSATEDYQFPGTNVKITKGTMVWIPVHAIHRDPRYFSDPEVFDPERFNEENVEKRHQSHYMPFGDGPRHCVGLRFANYSVKIGLIVILKNFKVEACDKTDIPLVYSPKSEFIIQPLNGITLKFTKLS